MCKLTRYFYNRRMYYAYVLKSKVDGSLYFGSTTDLRQRVISHNKGQVISTKKRKPWHIVWYGSFDTEAKAVSFEKYLKTASGKAFARKRLV